MNSKVDCIIIQLIFIFVSWVAMEMCMLAEDGIMKIIMATTAYQ